MNPHTVPIRLILICSSVKAVSGVACMSIRRPSTSSQRRSALRRCTRSSRYSRSPAAASSARRAISGSSFTLTKMSSNIARVQRISVSSSGPGVPSQRAARRAGARLATSATFSRPSVRRGDQLLRGLRHELHERRDVGARGREAQDRDVALVARAVVGAEDELAGEVGHLHVVGLDRERLVVGQHLDDVVVSRDHGHPVLQQDGLDRPQHLEGLLRVLDRVLLDHRGDRLEPLPRVVGDVVADPVEVVEDRHGQ